MSTGMIILLSFAIIFVFGILPLLIMGGVLYVKLLVRTSKKKWSRECCFPEDKEYKKMFDDGIAWSEKYKDKKLAIECTNKGCKLVGEYFNFGCDKAVIIISGRMESLLYSYYYAEPYRSAGYNVLVIDNRAHGNSEGIINRLGYKEYKDILVWSKLLHEVFDNKTVFLHGICIGSSTALFTLTSARCPDYISGMVAEGMYTTFGETTKNHMIEGDHPLFPIFYVLLLHIRVFSNANVFTDGPVKRIKKMKKPILFLHSKEDIYSIPEKALLLFDSCPSENKKLVWFDKGMHSRIRINDPQKYDTSIYEFLKSNSL